MISHSNSLNQPINPIIDRYENENGQILPEDDNRPFECAICFRRNGRTIFVTECGHSIHTTCLKRHVQYLRKKECPCCDQLLTKRDVVKVSSIRAYENLATYIHKLIQNNLFPEHTDGVLKNINLKIKHDHSLSDDQLNNLMSIIITNLNFKQADDMLKTIFELGGMLTREELNSGLYLSYCSNKIFEKHCARFLYEMGGRLTKNELDEGFNAALLNNTYIDFITIKLYFEIGGFLNQAELNNALQDVLSKKGSLRYDMAKFLFDRGAKITPEQAKSALRNALELPSSQRNFEVQLLSAIGGKLSQLDLYDAVLTHISNCYDNLDLPKLVLLFELGVKLKQEELKFLINIIIEKPDKQYAATLLYWLFQQGGNLIEQAELDKAIRFSLKHCVTSNVVNFIAILFENGGCIEKSEADAAISLALKNPNHDTITLIEILQNRAHGRVINSEIQTSISTAIKQNKFFVAEKLRQFSDIKLIS